MPINPAPNRYSYLVSYSRIGLLVTQPLPVVFACGDKTGEIAASVGDKSTRRLMIVGNDGMLTAKSQSAMTFHIDGIPDFAFPGRINRLDGSNKSITR